MRKTYKYRLMLNKSTEQKLHWILTRCRELYNAGLSERRDAWKYAYTSITCYDQINDLPEIKAVREEYQDIGSHVLQDVLRRLDKAFQSFFRRVKQGENPGFPRFQGRHRYDSFTYPDKAGWKLESTEGSKKARLVLTKVGNIRVVLHRPIEGTIKTVTIKREAEHWYVCFSCEVAQPEPLLLSYEDVGLDLGVTHFAALSTGEFIDNPRQYRKAEKRLQKLQQALSRKKRGSHRRASAVKAVARAHRKVRNQRKDFAHKASRQIVNHYQVIALELCGHLTPCRASVRDNNRCRIQKEQVNHASPSYPTE